MSCIYLHVFMSKVCYSVVYIYTLAKDYKNHIENKHHIIRIQLNIIKNNKFIRSMSYVLNM